MFIFNKITVKPQLPKRINRLGEIANNVWWSWNTEFLRLFKQIDRDLWEKQEKNPVRFLKLVSQEQLEKAANNNEFLRQYDRMVDNFDGYMNSKNTWFSRNYPNNRNDLIAYFSAEYGLDQILPIYSGGLGILSGDHLKTASDLGLPLVGVGLLYKNGYFHQKIDGHGNQQTEYHNIDITSLPISPVKDQDGNDLIIYVKFPKRRLYLKVWQIHVGRVNLYLLDSDIEENADEYKNVTTTLYGGDQEMRIQQEIVLGMAGVSLLRKIGLDPTVYHMNEGHSAFLTIELMKNVMKDKEVSLKIAKDIVSAKTVFTTHTPVPAGNDIFPVELVEKYFKDYWNRLGITREEFLELGMNPKHSDTDGFNMGILALKIAGKKNGVSKLHREVSSELFANIWPNIPPDESPITYVTNGIHTCSWLSSEMKSLYNEYLTPYWQDSIYKDETWNRIEEIPNEKLWKAHCQRKEKLLEFVKQSTIARLRRCNYRYEDINQIVSGLNPKALTIGFARRFATYKRGTLLFRDLERITQIMNDAKRPVQLIIAGKAHPLDQEGQNLIRYIHELSLKPQFKGKIFLLENYNIAMSRYLISGVDVWLNTPRRPMEASGTSGQKASVNGVINFSILDGWWAEGYNQENGWSIGTNQEYHNYDEQDEADSQSIYDTLENKIIPTYYNQDVQGVSQEWMKIMKNSIMTTGGRFSTQRMVIDYIQNLYMPMADNYKEYYTSLEKVTELEAWKQEIYRNWPNVKVQNLEEPENLTVDAGNTMQVKCKVKIPGLMPEDVEVQVYFGRVKENGVMEKISVTPMERIRADSQYETDAGEFIYEANINFTTGGEYGYTFRVLPKNHMILDNENLDLLKWVEG